MDAKVEEKKTEQAKDATATTPAPESKGLETWTADQLKAAYEKSPELFAQAGIVQPKQEEKPPVEEKKAEEKKDASGEKPKATEGVAQPVDLGLKLPADVPMDEVAVKKFTAIMSDEKSTNAQKAQQILDMQAGEYRRAVEAAKSRDAKFEEVLKNDPEFGKDFEENMEYAKQGLSKFDKSGEVAKKLVEIGAHKDPVLTRYFRDIGKASSEAITKRPDHGPSKEAEAESDQLRSRYNNSPGMFGEETPAQ